MLVINNLHKRFGKLQVLDGVSFEIIKGGIFAVLGPNGSGKTTLLKSILGMVIPDNGEIEINHNSVIGKNDYRNNIAYLPQIAKFPDNLTVKELIKMIADIRGRFGRYEELIERFKLKLHLHKKLGELSGGTRQKVNIVLTFMFEAEICILDEPTAGLDPVALLELKKLIEEEKEKGRIILITTHIMPLVEELAHEIIFLLDGKVRFKGSVKSLMDQTGKTNVESAIASMLSQ